MNGYEQFIAVTLASVLALFLLFGIIVLIMVIGIINRIKRIAEKAENIADKAEAVGDFFKTASGPFLLAKFLKNMRNVVHKRTNESKRSK
jgi:hypothetical protein